MLRTLLAPNPSTLTLDGTRTYLVGRRRVAVIDPGPALPVHIDAVASAVLRPPAGGDSGDEANGAPPAAEILLTHGHPDHADAADALAGRLGAPVRAVARGTLAAGDRIETDAGELVTVPTPGHTRDHVAFHWPAGAAVFCGDLVMGGQETALVAAPEGELEEYLASLERVRALGPRVLYPAHGPPFHDPPAALDAYVRHRRERERQVLAALEAGARDVAALVAAVYGPGLDPALRPAATAAMAAYLQHLARAGRIRREPDGRWVPA